MKLEIDASMLQRFPVIQLGICRGTIHSASDAIHAELELLQQQALASLRQKVPDVQLLATHPHVAAWRSTYEAFNVKPKAHPPTHEALAKRLLKGGAWPRINPIVDIYLTNQVEHLLPHGGYDVSTLEGDLRLTLSPGGEPFEPLGGGSETTNPGEPVYKDRHRVLTRRWNYRDCDATKITEGSRTFVLMLEAADERISLDAVRRATEGLAERYRRCFQGEFLVQTITASAAGGSSSFVRELGD